MLICVRVENCKRQTETFGVTKVAENTARRISDLLKYYSSSVLLNSNTNLLEQISVLNKGVYSIPILINFTVTALEVYN